MINKIKLPLSEVAYQEIKQRILRLEYRPGQFLNELEICKLLNMGRTPVHQAVHRLMVDGFLDIIPRKGLLIRPDSMNEVLNLLEARWVLEPGVAALAAERATPEQIRRIQSLLDDDALGNDATGKDQDKRAHYMAVDYEFHSTIAQAAGNNILADLIRPLHERSGRLWHLQLQTDNDMELTSTEHKAIFEALVRGDKDGAARAMQAHLASLKRRRLPKE